ncbi:MAG: TlpA family protein disulfide reductase [Proteobacteria bacterium]|nr:TlpA family protein disulfide reductase [Pseudomonadota bacterium]
MKNTIIQSGTGAFKRSLPEGWAKNRKLFVFIVLFGLLIHLPAGGSLAGELQVGDRAPNLNGFDAEQASRLNLYRTMTEMRFKRDEQGNLVMKANGKYASEFIHNVMVLNFFARTCIPCLREIPTLNRIAKKYRGKRVKFLYVNVDPDLEESQMKRLIRQYGIEVPVMLPNQNEAMRKYNAVKLPRLVVVGRNKRIASILTGFHEDLESRMTGLIDGLLVD